ncbi:unnamed protein product, partial [Nesidiocoris tenuis]
MGTKKTKGADELRETFRSFDCLAESGEYIRHPVLYELSHKYGLQTESVPEAALPNKLEELKELIRREIRKELKIKEGAEKLREASKDRKSLSDVAHIVKKSNSKLSELQAELQELESQIILTQGQGEPPKNGHGSLRNPRNGRFNYAELTDGSEGFHGGQRSTNWRRNWPIDKVTRGFASLKCMRILMRLNKTTIWLVFPCRVRAGKCSKCQSLHKHLLKIEGGNAAVLQQQRTSAIASDGADQCNCFSELSNCHSSAARFAWYATGSSQLDNPRKRAVVPLKNRASFLKNNRRYMTNRGNTSDLLWAQSEKKLLPSFLRDAPCLPFSVPTH